jgi:hypothetical protein
MELEKLISLTPARTLAGARVQLMLLQHIVEIGMSNDDDIAGLGNAIATLGRLAGEARRV